MPKNRRWVNPLLAVTLLVAVGAAFYPLIRAARRDAWRANQLNNFRQILLAIHNFHDSYQRLPTAMRRDESGRPLSSWRFQLVPYLESLMQDVDFSERWDDPTNCWCLPGFFWCYASPFEYGDMWSARADIARCNTSIVAVTGPGTAFDGDRFCRFEDLDRDTILIIEMAHTDICWAEPGDLDVQHVPASITRGTSGDGVYVGLADGSAHFLSHDVPLKELNKFFTIEGAEQHDFQEVLGPYIVR